MKTIKKIFATDGKGYFIGIDEASGGYPWSTDNLNQALILDENVENLHRLQSLVDSHSRGFNSEEQRFEVVTATISFEMKKASN